MSPENHKRLAASVTKAAQGALASQGYVRPIDVLIGIGWLDQRRAKEWRAGRIDYLERAVQANLKRISAAMKLLRAFARAHRLVPRETAYVSRGGKRRRLRFSKSGEPSIERFYCTHWLSPELVEKKGAGARTSSRRAAEEMSLADRAIEMYIARTTRLFELETAGKLTGIAERDAPFMRDEEDWTAWREWRVSPQRKPFVDTEGWERSVVAVDCWCEFEVWRPPDGAGAPDDWIAEEMQRGAAACDGTDARGKPQSLRGETPTLSEAEALGGLRDMIPPEWEEWARLEPFEPLIGVFEEEGIEDLPRAAPKRRRGSRKFMRRRKRKGRRRNGGSGR